MKTQAHGAVSEDHDSSMAELRGPEIGSKRSRVSKANRKMNSVQDMERNVSNIQENATKWMRKLATGLKRPGTWKKKKLTRKETFFNE